MIRGLTRTTMSVIINNANVENVQHRNEYKIFHMLKDMPYFRNYAAVSGNVHNVSKHEDAVKDIFIKNELIEWIPHKKMSKKKVEETLNSNANSIDIPPYCFVCQPCGTHGNPDFVVRFDKNIFGFECKSTTDSSFCPMYNSGGIKPNYIYIFSNERMNQTTLYKGSDIITNRQTELITELIQKQKQIEEEYNKLLNENDMNHRGVAYYTRPMIIQSGDATKTNYFTHANKETCEKNVLDYLLS
mgnify:CR=1 FL=1